MRYLKKISFLVVLSLLLGCKDEEVIVNPDLQGTWELIEQYADPGDGSGEYEAVDSDREITFLSDGTFTTNGSMCGMTMDSGTVTTGTYSETDGSMDVEECNFEPLGLRFEINEGHLFILYPCIEGCGQKYKKTED